MWSSLMLFLCSPFMFSFLFFLLELPLSPVFLPLQSWHCVSLLIGFHASFSLCVLDVDMIVYDSSLFLI